MPEQAEVLAFDVGGTRVKAGIVRGAEVSELYVELLPVQKDAPSVIDALVRLGRQVQVGHNVQAVGVSVNDLRLEAGGLHQDSTATRHTFAGVPLWLPCPMDQG